MTLEETIKDTQAQTRPPEKLSDLIRLAVKDARRMNPDEYWPDAGIFHQRFEVNTEDWNTEHYGPPPPPNACHACVAGAVIAGTLKTSPDEPRSPMSFEKGWSGSLYALDRIRCGDYDTAYLYHYIGYISPIEEQLSAELRMKLNHLSVNYPPVHRGFANWEQFKAHIDSLEVIADIFEGEGL